MKNQERERLVLKGEEQFYLLHASQNLKDNSLKGRRDTTGNRSPGLQQVHKQSVQLRLRNPGGKTPFEYARPDASPPHKRRNGKLKTTEGARNSNRSHTAIPQDVVGLP
ncbi:hypothetical protein HPP92_023528 [Vanilla planifolia]|uniref:Uncharacterized protein n=1 Tax=Vanilla planifolia TaxID=51239 RepID=A0A835PTZ6_VANPL|nr:hypothetical protein HPP92_023528 [Vanilla planifolia]